MTIHHHLHPLLKKLFEYGAVHIGDVIFEKGVNTAIDIIGNRVIEYGQSKRLPIPAPEDSNIKELINKAYRAEEIDNEELAYQIWQPIAYSRNLSNHAYVIIAKSRVQHLLPNLVTLYRQRAREAHENGNWLVEIIAWNNLLSLKDAVLPDHILLDKDLLEVKQSKYLVKLNKRGKLTQAALGQEIIIKRLSIAVKNADNQLLYDEAERAYDKIMDTCKDWTNKNAAIDAAVNAAVPRLQTLRQTAPFYGDPKGLMTRSFNRIIIPPNYEQSLVEERERKAEAERKRVEAEKLKKAEEEQKRIEAEIEAKRQERIRKTATWVAWIQFGVFFIFSILALLYYPQSNLDGSGIFWTSLIIGGVAAGLAYYIMSAILNKYG